MFLFLQIATLMALIFLVFRMEAIGRQLDALDRRITQTGGHLKRRSTPADTAAQPQPEMQVGAGGPEERGRGGRTEPVRAAPQVTRPEPATARVEVEVARGAVETRASASASATPPVAAPPADAPLPTRPRVDLELRFGRRWAALLGGGLVAFGLALLVRQSIQQGYFPPAVRLAGAALLSLVLCGAAEIFRRSGTFAAPTDAGLARRAADIPSVLLGTGLGGLFAVTYAAHAVYGYIAVGPTFAVMVAAALSGIAASLAYGPALAVLGYLAAQAVPLLIGDWSTPAGAAYLALVGVGGYAAAHLGRWHRLENPAGLVLLLWASLLHGGSLLDLALVAMPASAAALAFTALRMRPRAAWTDWRPSRQACAALGLMAGQGLLLASHVDDVGGGVAYDPLANAFGLAVLLSAFAFSATATRTRPMAPPLAAAVVGAVATLGVQVAGGDFPYTAVLLGPSPSQLAGTVALVSAAVLAVAAVALHRGSRRAPITGLLGAASGAVLLAASDLALHLAGGLDREVLAGFAATQGATLLLAARPKRSVIPPARHFATAAAASVGAGLLGSAVVLAFGDGPLTALALALTAAGAAALARAWALPLFASVAGISAVPVLLRAGLGVFRDALAAEGGEAALRPLLENTLLPGLVLTGTVLVLSRRPGAGAVRDADGRWLGLLGVRSPRPAAGRSAASLVLAGTAAGSLLLGALVGIVRFIAFGDPYAPLSAPADLGLACTLTLSAALAALRLHGSIPVGTLHQGARALTVATLPLCGVALLANPFVTGSSVGALPFLNLLVISYLLPAAVAWRLAREDGAPDGSAWRTLASAMAIANLLGYATFAVAQAFEGPVLSLGNITEAELWTYTTVWLAVGAALLAYGIRVGARAARIAALGIVAVTAAKVVFVDLADLTGTARALSVLALGLVLLGIGMAYQRLSAVGGQA